MTTKPNDGGPAFPVFPDTEAGHASAFTGATLRDYFAAHAPEPPNSWHGGERLIMDIIDWRWHYADSMLKARNT